MNSITIFLSGDVMRDILNSATAVGNKLKLLSWICVWSLGIIFIHLEPNKRLNAVFFSTDDDDCPNSGARKEGKERGEVKEEYGRIWG